MSGLFRRLSSRRAEGPEGTEPQTAAEPGTTDAPASHPAEEQGHQSLHDPATGYVPQGAPAWTDQGSTDTTQVMIPGSDSSHVVAGDPLAAHGEGATPGGSGAQPTPGADHPSGQPAPAPDASYPGAAYPDGQWTPAAGHPGAQPAPQAGYPNAAYPAQPPADASPPGAVYPGAQPTPDVGYPGAQPGPEAVYPGAQPTPDPGYPSPQPGPEAAYPGAQPTPNLGYPGAGYPSAQPGAGAGYTGAVYPGAQPGPEAGYPGAQPSPDAGYPGAAYPGAQPVYGAAYPGAQPVSGAGFAGQPAPFAGYPGAQLAPAPGYPAAAYPGVPGQPEDVVPVADLPAGLDADELAAAPPTSARRGKLRRRAAFLRAAREVLLRDLGGFVYELHRTAHDMEHGAHRRLRETKLGRLTRVDIELHQIETRLDDVRRQVLVREPGVGGECPECGELFSSSAHFCSHCGLPLTESARKALAARVAAPEPALAPDPVIAPIPVATAPVDQPTQEIPALDPDHPSATSADFQWPSRPSEAAAPTDATQLETPHGGTTGDGEATAAPPGEGAETPDNAAARPDDETNVLTPGVPASESPGVTTAETPGETVVGTVGDSVAEPIEAAAADPATAPADETDAQTPDAPVTDTTDRADTESGAAAGDTSGAAADAPSDPVAESAGVDEEPVADATTTDLGTTEPGVDEPHAGGNDAQAAEGEAEPHDGGTKSAGDEDPPRDGSIFSPVERRP